MDTEEESLCFKEWDIIQPNVSQDSAQCVTIGHCTDSNFFQEIALLRSSLTLCSPLCTSYDHAEQASSECKANRLIRGYCEAHGS